MAYRPTAKGTNFIQAGLDGLFKGYGPICRCCCFLQQLKRFGLLPHGIGCRYKSYMFIIDFGENIVVLLCDLADFGVRLDGYGLRKVIGLALVVHGVQQIENFGAGAMLGDIEANAFSPGVNSEREPAVNQP